MENFMKSFMDLTKSIHEQEKEAMLNTTSMLTQRLHKVESKKAALKNNLANCEQKSISLQKTCLKHQEEVKNLQEALINLNRECKQLKKQNEQLTIEKNQLSIDINNITLENNKLSQENQELRDQMDQYNANFLKIQKPMYNSDVFEEANAAIASISEASEDDCKIVEPPRKKARK